MPDNERVLVVHNPSAGRGRAASRIAQLSRALAEAGIPNDVVATHSQGQAVVLAARSADSGYTVVVAAGGDGTINEVINGLALTMPESKSVGPVGVYPIGGGNDFAHSLRIDADPAALVQAISSRQIRSVDLGLATLHGSTGELRRYFHNSMGYGLEASVTQESDQIRNLSGGILYLVAAFRALRSYATPWAAIEWTDALGQRQTVEQAITIVSIGNAKRTGGAFYLTPDAQVDDQLFDVALAGAMSRLRLLTLLPRALVGKHTGARSVRMLRCRQIRACSRVPLPVHMDGEVVMVDAVEVEAVVQPGRLAILG